MVIGEESLLPARVNETRQWDTLIDVVEAVICMRKGRLSWLMPLANCRRNNRRERKKIFE